MRDLRLVDQPGNRPHLSSMAELDAYVKGRLDARAYYNEQETERRAAEQAAWRKAGARRQNVRFAIFVVAYLAFMYGAAWLLWPR